MTVLTTNPVFIKENLVTNVAKVEEKDVICGAYLSGIELLSSAVTRAGLGVDLSASDAVMVRLQTDSPAEAQELLQLIQGETAIIGIPELSERSSARGLQLVLTFKYPEFLLSRSGETLTPQSRELVQDGVPAEPIADSMKVHESVINIGDIDLDMEGF